MKKLILSLLISAGLIVGLQVSSPPPVSIFNQAGVFVQVRTYSPYEYSLYPNYTHPDQNWHRWHHGWWGWHHHPWRHWHYW